MSPTALPAPTADRTLLGSSGPAERSLCAAPLQVPPRPLCRTRVRTGLHWIGRARRGDLPAGNAVSAEREQPHVRRSAPARVDARLYGRESFGGFIVGRCRRSPRLAHSALPQLRAPSERSGPSDLVAQATTASCRGEVIAMPRAVTRLAWRLHKQRMQRRATLTARPGNDAQPHRGG